MMRELEILLKGHDIIFDAIDRKVMRYGHVVDLSSGRIIDGLITMRTGPGLLYLAL
jgi:hypothetical protein